MEGEEAIIKGGRKGPSGEGGEKEEEGGNIRRRKSLCQGKQGREGGRLMTPKLKEKKKEEGCGRREKSNGLILHPVNARRKRGKFPTHMQEARGHFPPPSSYSARCWRRNLF